MSATWRLIQSGGCGAAYNMALDEAIACCVRKGVSPPALRLYTWETKSLTLGCSQRISDIDVKYCESKNIPVVRRPTGGRAILHDDELTYSFSMGSDRELFPKGLLGSYEKIGCAFSLALKKVGVFAEAKKRREKGKVLSGSPLCFQSSSFAEILVNGKKILGSAQKRWVEGFLQQGAMPFSYNEDEMRRIFGIDKTEGLTRCMTGLRKEAPGVDEAAIRNAIAASFEEIFNVTLLPSLPLEEEIALARELEGRKYRQPEWNFQK